METTQWIRSQVLSSFSISEDATVSSFGTGLINHTWKVNAGDNEYILQRVNENVFKRPEDIAFNLDIIAGYLQQHFPAYFFVAPLHTRDGRSYVRNEEGFFRLLPFVKGSYSHDVVDRPEQAYEAAKQFGRFSHLLSGLDATELKITIPSFHDLTLRYQQFLSAIENGNKQKKERAKSEIDSLLGYASILDKFQQVKESPEVPLRVVHHDTKISNVLFDASGKAICIIDMDTVMPGYFISDVGDMMRTYLSPCSEEETDFKKICVRQEYYDAIIEGYLSEMREVLTEREKQLFHFSGQYIIYMQALRFITDYLLDDIYYGAKYPDHNFMRGKNQLLLLEQFEKLKRVL
jgi:Ser/Thr protein kinase RdoA (MazF antagonist)